MADKASKELKDKLSDLSNKANEKLDSLFKINTTFFEKITSGWTSYEIILNILFILLLLLIGFIIYWDLINRKALKTSRCKKQKDLYDKNNGVYKVNVKTKGGDKLFNIQYDFKNKKHYLNCDGVCIGGEEDQTFSYIPIRNLESEKDEKVPLSCSCDKKYNYNNYESVIEGEPGIIRYMKDNESLDFFDSMKYNA